MMRLWLHPIRLFRIRRAVKRRFEKELEEIVSKEVKANNYRTHGRYIFQRGENLTIPAIIDLIEKYTEQATNLEREVKEHTMRTTDLKRKLASTDSYIKYLVEQRNKLVRIETEV